MNNFYEEIKSLPGGKELLLELKIRGDRL